MFQSLPRLSLGQHYLCALHIILYYSILTLKNLYKCFYAHSVNSMGSFNVYCALIVPFKDKCWPEDGLGRDRNM